MKKLILNKISITNIQEHLQKAQRVVLYWNQQRIPVQCFAYLYDASDLLKFLSGDSSISRLQKAEASKDSLRFLLKKEKELNMVFIDHEVWKCMGEQRIPKKSMSESINPLAPTGCIGLQWSHSWQSYYATFLCIGLPRPLQPRDLHSGISRSDSSSLLKLIWS